MKLLFKTFEVSTWIFYLTAGLLYAAALLRALLLYFDTVVFTQVVGLLLLSLALFASQAALTRRWANYFLVYLILQASILFVLLLAPDASDFFAALFGVLCMQVIQHYRPERGAVWIALFTPLMALPLLLGYGFARGLAFTLLYTAGNVILASYALAARRAQEARATNQTLALELERANRQLQNAAAQREKLAAARERNHLARELHDSATQTIFSMTLTTQSALLLLERDPARVGEQLERLGQLAASALAELRALISELRPLPVFESGLVSALREHLAQRESAENLVVAFEVDGDCVLAADEEQALFRIAQEALNNVVKHARVTRACLTLHLIAPCWMEIDDAGSGFALERATNDARVGLSSMRERAVEIGWQLEILTSPGAGTRIRVAQPSVEGNQ